MDGMNSGVQMKELVLEMNWNIFIVETVERIGGMCNDLKTIEVI